MVLAISIWLSLSKPCVAAELNPGQDLGTLSSVIEPLIERADQPDAPLVERLTAAAKALDVTTSAHEMWLAEGNPAAGQLDRLSADPRSLPRQRERLRKLLLTPDVTAECATGRYATNAETSRQSGIVRVLLANGEVAEAERLLPTLCWKVREETFVSIAIGLAVRGEFEQAFTLAVRMGDPESVSDILVMAAQAGQRSFAETALSRLGHVPVSILQLSARLAKIVAADDQEMARRLYQRAYSGALLGYGDDQAEVAIALASRGLYDEALEIARLIEKELLPSDLSQLDQDTVTGIAVNAAALGNIAWSNKVINEYTRGDSTIVGLARAGSAIAERDTAQARIWITQASLQLRPEQDGWTKGEVALAYAYLGDPDAAYGILNSFGNSSGDLGDAYWRRIPAEYKRAIAATLATHGKLDEAIAFSHRNRNAYHEAIALSLPASDFERAAEILLQASCDDHPDADILISRPYFFRRTLEPFSRTALSRGRPDLAIKLLRICLPEWDNLAYSIAKILRDLGNERELIALGREDPKYTQAAEQSLVEFHLDHDDLPAAVADLKDIPRDNWNSGPSIHDTVARRIAVYLAQTRDFTEAQAFARVELPARGLSGDVVDDPAITARLLSAAGDHGAAVLKAFEIPNYADMERNDVLVEIAGQM